MTDQNGNQTAVIPLGALRDKWMDVLRELYKINQTAPDIVAYFQIDAVDGDTVYLGTENEVFLLSLQNPRKIAAVQNAFFAVHHIQLTVVPRLRTGASTEPVASTLADAIQARAWMSDSDTPPVFLTPAHRALGDNPPPPENWCSDSITIYSDGSFTVRGNMTADELIKLLERTVERARQVAMNAPMPSLFVDNPGDPNYNPF